MSRSRPLERDHAGTFDGDANLLASIADEAFAEAFGSSLVEPE